MLLYKKAALHSRLQQHLNVIYNSHSLIREQYKLQKYSEIKGGGNYYLTKRNKIIITSIKND